MATFHWRGREVKARVIAATLLAEEEVMADCVHDASLDHPGYPPASTPGERYANRTGFETGSVRSNGASVEGNKIKGSWGAYTRYSLFLEIGTSIEGPTASQREDAAAGSIDAVTPPIGPLMAPRPFLRPAADRHYPGFAGKIRDRLAAP